MRRALVPLILALLAGLLPLILTEKSASGATTLPPGFQNTSYVGGLTSPTAMAFAPDGRLFVAEQGGKLRVVKPASGFVRGTLLSAPFVDLSAETDSSGERGLLGVAFDPNFATNKYVYVYYTRKATSTSPARNRVVRFTADGDRFVPRSGKAILELDALSAINHNGGAIHFGKDGKLYVAVGDNANSGNAQTLSNLHGKMLRINKDGTIPSDNPFYYTASGKNKAIWAFGLRNPYSFAVRPGTGTIYINDVGQKAWEEINNGIKGANYGWPYYEGPENDPKYTGPVFAYQHGDTNTTGCAITGGTFYLPPRVRFPSSYVGDYFFADFCNGWIRKFDPSTRAVTPFATGLPRYPVDLQVAPDGSLFYLSRVTFDRTPVSVVGRIRYGS